MKLSRLRKERLLPILINRTAIFFFLMSLLTIFLYAAGTVQGFIDTTQLNLLRLYVFLGIFLAAASVFGIFLELNRAVNQKRTRYLLRASAYLFLAVFGVATIMAALFILALSEGNRIAG